MLSSRYTYTRATDLTSNIMMSRYQQMLGWVMKRYCCFVQSNPLILLLYLRIVKFFHSFFLFHKERDIRRLADPQKCFAAFYNAEQRWSSLPLPWTGKSVLNEKINKYEHCSISSFCYDFHRYSVQTFLSNNVHNHRAIIARCTQSIAGICKWIYE